MTIAGVLILLATIKPTLSDAGFAIGMGVLGVGMGLMISQLGNVIQSSVEESGRSEAGGLQFTGQQLGSALGVAFIGAIVLIGLTNTFISTVEHDSRISAEVSTQVGVAAGSDTQLRLVRPDRDAAQEGGLDQATTPPRSSTTTRRPSSDRSRPGSSAAALLALISLAFTSELPHERPAPRTSRIPQWCRPEPVGDRRVAGKPPTAPMPGSAGPASAARSPMEGPSPVGAATACRLTRRRCRAS